MLDAILARIIRLNNHYGKGDVVGIILDSDYTGGTVTIHCPGLKREEKRFRFDCRKNTIHFLKHQTCLSNEMRL